MSNTEAANRTNYFRVKDLDAFKANLKRYGIDFGAWGSHSDIVLDEGSNNTPAGAIALFAEGFWPGFDEDSIAARLDIEDEETPVPNDFESIEALIAAHLVATDVAIVMGISQEKMRYVSGYAVAINAQGEERAINLDSIYALAEEIATDGTPVTRAQY